MKDLNLVPFKLTKAIDPKHFLLRDIVWMSLTLVLSGMTLFCSKNATAQARASVVKNHKEELENQKLELEITKLKNDFKNYKEELENQKLELEVKKLHNDLDKPSELLMPLLGIAVSAVSVVATVLISHRGRFSALDQSVHEKRIELYPKLVETTAPLALYFSPTKSIDSEECVEIGRLMRAWYFSAGCLILSIEARDAYFQLARALTLASLSERKLNVPLFPKDAKKISVDNVNDYRKKLGLEKTVLDVKQVENWAFGGSTSQLHEAACRFKDFVFLQMLSSTLRTKLAEDLRSRRKPAAREVEIRPVQQAAALGTDQ